MKIEIRKVKINNAMSEETVCFSADLHVNGVRQGTVTNSGRGGENDIRPLYGVAESRVAIQKAEAYCKTLPSVMCGQTELKMDLEFYVSQLIDDISNAKERASFDRKAKSAMLKGIVFGDSRQGSFQVHQWKGMTLAQVMAHPQGRGIIAKVVANIRAGLRPGQTIWNDNLGDLLK